jgi:preprotein translocase subunit SecB
MFPFVRNIISDTVQNGGYPPLLIEPIDFASLYIEKKQSESAPTAAPEVSTTKN